MKTYSIKTLGCKNNQYESGVLAAALRRDGLCEVAFGDRADYVIVNTCTVTDISDHKCRQYIRSGARTSANGRVIVTGCLANRAKDELLCMQEVSSVFTSDEKAELLMSISGKSTVSGQFELPFHRSRAQLKIQDGCDGNCSYCIIPAVRGRPRSRPRHEILDEAKFLIDRGYHELVLTGITIGKYSHEGDLADLIERLIALPGDFRVRVTSIEPVHVSSHLVDLYQSPMLCPHIHLPLQGGDDSILRMMNRPYTLDEYSKIVLKLKEAVADIAIGTDLIVGFPGETEETFVKTLDFISQIGYSYVHQFTFSPRQGTPAAQMQQNSSAEQIAERSQRLRNLTAGLRGEYVRRFTGKTLRCVVERGGEKLRAMTPHYLHVSIDNTNPDYSPGDFAMVKIGPVQNMNIRGQIVDDCREIL